MRYLFCALPSGFACIQPILGSGELRCVIILVSDDEGILNIRVMLNALHCTLSFMAENPNMFAMLVGSCHTSPNPGTLAVMFSLLVLALVCIPMGLLLGLMS